LKLLTTNITELKIFASNIGGQLASA